MALLVVLPFVGRGALIESHDDIRAQLFLHLDGFFGGEAVGRAVDVAFEGDPVFIDLAHIGQGENLETARIGQHRAAAIA